MVDFNRLCAGIPFLACLSEQDKTKISATVIYKNYSKNQPILLEEDETSYFYFIVSGRVKAAHINNNGRELMFTMYKRYDCFGEMAILDGQTSPATIVAMENCKLGLIPKSNFVKLIMNNDKSLQQINTLLCTRLRESLDMLKVPGLAEANDKVRAALKIISQKFGAQDKNGVIINIKLDHKDIARLAYVSRETASRIISSLMKSGEIELVDKKYFLLTPSFMGGA